MTIGPISPFSTPYVSTAASGEHTIWRPGKPRPVVPNSVFVIMSFEEGMDQVHIAIKEECKKLQLEAKRADDYKGSHVVMAKIAEEIEKAELIICDLTCERPNVYYELGYAHGVGNGGDRILLIANKETQVHFDIKILNNETYSTTEDLRRILRETLPVMLHQCRSAKTWEADESVFLPSSSGPPVAPKVPSIEPKP
jgi:hypothetical protein